MSHYTIYDEEMTDNEELWAIEDENDPRIAEYLTRQGVKDWLRENFDVGDTVHWEEKKVDENEQKNGEEKGSITG